MNNKLSIISLSSLSLLAAFATAAEAASAGRVIVAAGETSALRAGREVPLNTGADVEVGDTVRVGANSSMQIRFADEALMSLRANSVLKVESYNFVNKPSEDSAVLSLLKGGVRTVTGVIGRISRADYNFKTPTSTIGIRGTHFTLRQCTADCDDNGGPAPADGLYGGVTDGRIAVKNEAGEREFGQQDYFYVASATDLPRPLLVPPSFLRDKHEARARSKGNKAPAGTSTSEAVADKVVDSATTSVAAQPVSVATVTLAAPPVAETIVSPSEQLQATGTAPAPYIKNVVLGKATNDDLAGTSFVNAESEVRHFTVEKILPSFFQVGGTQLYTNSNGNSGTYTASGWQDSGSSVAAGNASWGRWNFSDIGSGPSGNYSFSGIEHRVTGDPVVSLPGSGVLVYDWVGGTTPTTSNGQTGAWIDHGKISVDFTARNMSTATPLQYSGPSTAIYSLDFSNQPLPAPSGKSDVLNSSFTNANGETSGNFSVTRVFGTTITPVATCSGGGCSTVNFAQIAPLFMGSDGRGLGLSIVTAAATASGPERLASAQAYATTIPTTPPDTTTTPPPDTTTTPTGGYTLAMSGAENGTGSSQTSCTSGPLCASFPNQPATPTDFNFTFAADETFPTSFPARSTITDGLYTSGGTITDHSVTNGTSTSGGTTTSYSIDITTTIVQSPAVDRGSDLAAGNLVWGRYQSTDTTSVTNTQTDASGTNTFTTNDSETRWHHFTDGDVVTALPSSGVFTYNHVGSTTPTSLTGPSGGPFTTGTGAWVSHGQVSVDFTSQTMSTASPIVLSGPSTASYTLGFSNQAIRTVEPYTPPAGNTFTATVSGSVAVNGGSTTSYSYTYDQNALPFNNVTYKSFAPSVSCSGGGCQSATGEVSAQFFGSSGQGLGLAISTTGNLSSGNQEKMAAVKAYKR